MTERPRRRFRIEVTCEGHAWDEVIEELECMVSHLKEHGKECRFVSGFGWVRVTEDPQAERETYHESLLAYLRMKKESSNE